MSLSSELGKARYLFSFIRRYPAEETRRKFVEFEEIYGSYITNTATVANLPPNAPGDQPRFSLQGGRKQLIVSNVAAQLNLDFTEGFPKAQTLESVLNKASEQADKMDAIFGHQERFYSGIVASVTMQFKGQPDETLSRIYNDLLKLPPRENLSVLNLAVGYERGGINRQVGISQYKMIETIQPPSSVARVIHVDFDFTEANEEGLEFKFDVNTKPQIAQPTPGQFTQLARALIELTNEDGEAPWAGAFK